MENNFTYRDINSSSTNQRGGPEIGFAYKSNRFT